VRSIHKIEQRNWELVIFDEHPHIKIFGFRAPVDKSEPNMAEEAFKEHDVNVCDSIQLLMKLKITT
jgi:hypothetical protein